MSKSRARFLSELLGTTGLVKKTKSALAGADEIIDLSTLPSIPNSKLTNSSISIAGHSTALGGSVTLDTADIGEDTNLYYTDARARAAISVSGNAISYNNSTGVLTANFEEGPVFTGAVTANAGITVDNITIDGSTITAGAANDLTIDAVGDIILDADGGDIKLKDAGTLWASVYTNGTNTYIQNMVNSGDVYLSGKDGSGNGVNALILDMSDGGTANFSGNITLSDNKQAQFGDSADGQIYHDGSHFRFRAATGNFNVQADDFHLTDASNTSIRFRVDADGPTRLYHNGNLKLETTSTGIDVTGVAVVDGLASSGAITSTSGSNNFGTTTISNLSVTGDLSITGNINSYNVTDLDVTDKTITVNAGGSQALSDGAGLIIDRGSETNASITWNETTDTIVANQGFEPNWLYLEDQNGTVSSLFGIYGWDDELQFTKRNLSTRAHTGTLLSLNYSTNAAHFLGSVGIGTTPISAANLHLSSAGETAFYVDGTQTSDGTIFDLVVRNGTDSVTSIKTLRTGANDAGALTFGTQTTGGSLTERMRIDSSGNVGIGRTPVNTLNPSLELVDGGSLFGFGKSLYLTANLYYASGWKAMATGAGASYVFDSAHKFYTNASVSANATATPEERMRIQADGNVGIGTDSPVALSGQKSLTINGNVARVDLQVSETTTGSLISESGYIHLQPASGGKALIGNGGSDLVVDSAGKVGIGEAAPEAKLHVMTASNGATTVGSASDELILENSADCGLTIRSGSSSDGVISFADADDHNVGQVYYSHSSNSMTFRTNDAIQMSINSSGTVDVANDLVANNAKLKAIDESNTDTAIDIFIYDTRKDSDGGAWRKRTQNTSWYNETLNTSTRGARKEFPCVAVLVAEDDTLTIYDGDDPDLPMWMIFNSSGANGVAMLGRPGESTTSVEMLNGILCVGRKSFGLHIVHFIGDFAEFKEDGYDTPYALPIGTNRNSGNSWVTVNRGNDLVNDTVMDVAMTILPNARINTDTGLPIPTIAVGTDAGVSIIKDDGSVVDITHINYTEVHEVKFLPSGGIAYTSDSSSNQRWLHLDHTISNTNVTKSNGYEGHLDSEMYHVVDGSTYNGQDMKFSLDKLDRGFIVDNHGDIVVAGSSGGFGGLGLIARNPANPSNGLIAEISSKYNTGWMPGGALTTKLATLSDTDTTNVTGSELISGGNFSNWSTRGGAGFTVNGNGTASLSNGDGTTDGWLDSPSFSTVNGKTYVVRIETSSNSGTGFGIYYNYGNGPNGYMFGRTFTFVANGGTTTLSLYRYNGHNGTATLDSISVRVAEEDRSITGQGVQVFGTVTKSAVATGAELVGYSGFSHATGGNYLRKPYDSTLDLGTGDFIFSIWCKLTAASASYDFLWEPQTASSNDRFYILRNVSSGNLYLPYNTNIADTYIHPGKWTKVDIVRRNNIASQYINGKKAGASYTSNQNLNASSASGQYRYTHIGCYYDGVYGWNGSLALAKISAIAPTEEQIAKMYNDEKYLFAENAKATIYGSSNIPQALAYDSSTDLVHVGTSAGRSVFQGLNRVDNTTDAVGAVISASNGFIAED